MTQEIGPNQRKWLDALHSGNYRQTKHMLRNKDGHCCLGVACEVLGLVPKHVDGVYSFDGSEIVAPPSVVETLRLYSNEGGTTTGTPSGRLTGFNDTGTSFSKIADIIEHDPSRYFREPA